MTPHEHCRAEFHYSPETGEFRAVHDHSVLFGRSKDGRTVVVYHKKTKPVTHVIWYWMTGEWPKKDRVIDHIDRDPSDNRWKNLRNVTRSQNNRNRSDFRKYEWLCSVNFQGESYFHGWFNSKEERDKVRDSIYAKLEQVPNITTL